VRLLWEQEVQGSNPCTPTITMKSNMTEIFVYNTEGKIVNNLKIDDELTYLSGRVHKGKTVYYKGLGVPYSGHSVMNINSYDDYSNVQKSNVFYIGYAVSKKCFEGKTGIFQERYQPFFPDFIGSCGIKEGTIVLNSSTFKLSSVDVIDCVEYDAENQQYYYSLDYRCGRKSYLNHDGDPYKLVELIDYMLVNDWNFLWDKGSINDISFDGRVSDVADLFVSKDLKHKLGTVYSVLYSLEKLDRKKYDEVLNVYGFDHRDQRSFIFNSIKILDRNDININELFTEKTINKIYKSIVLNYLVNGKNCAYCACDLYKNNGDKIAENYKTMISEQLKNL
jgi:hypothetical protein